MPNTSSKNKEEIYWRKALDVSSFAVNSGSLIPIKTKIIKTYNKNNNKFEIRFMLSKSPLNLIKGKPNNNPFQPWNKELEVSSIGNKHTLILNKYPVQTGHMLLITNNWAPQNGWLTMDDWLALKQVDNDTSGLWFFNSGPDAGASQPHRHIQLLRREDNCLYCPRDVWYEDVLCKRLKDKNNFSNSIFVIKRSETDNALNINDKYLQASISLGIGNPENDNRPRTPYNLLISKNWIAVIKRSKEGIKGFSINALGFAGYILATEESDLVWLEKYGPEYLLGNLVKN